jgi:hypothetical protein
MAAEEEVLLLLEYELESAVVRIKTIPVGSH